MLAMSDHDIYVEYKTAKRPEEQIKILAEPNGTKKEKIEEIINRMKLKEEQEMSQTKERTPEQKAKKAAYMKEYWARKKAEKESAAKTQQEETEQKPVAEPITIQVQSTAPSDPRPDDSELIRKALQNFSIGLEEAIEDQKAVLAATKKKLAAMEEDLKRCRELLGCEIGVKED